MYYLRSLSNENSYILIMDKAYFPYGNKSKEFLLKRTLFLCNYLYNIGVDKIILACNTLSIIVLPFIKLFYPQTEGVFQELIPYINKDSAILASNRSCVELRKLYPNNLIIDGSALIYKIENNMDYNYDLLEINKKIANNSNIILACTHFLALNQNFNKKSVKNRNNVCIKYRNMI